jgi:hypothetical protein
MFARLNKLFRTEHRSDLVSNEALDIIKRYQRFTDEERREFLSVFGFVKTRLERSHGEIDAWALKQKAVVAGKLLTAAKEAYSDAPYGSCGVALVALYLEAQSLPGEKAQRVVCLIDEWHRRVTAADLRVTAETGDRRQSASA